ncbi:MAG: peptidoglycan recognition family protein [Candidatus Paceibacterota bacterium]
MTTRLSFVTQPYHKNDTDRVFFNAYKPRTIEFVVTGEEPEAPDLSYVPQDTLIVLRHYSMSENWGNRTLTSREQAEAQGNEHANFGKRLVDDAVASYRIDANRILLTGLNEPQLWSGEPPNLFAYYEAARMRRLHSFGLRAQFCKFGVGWPANSGTDTPPVWTPFAPIMQEYKAGDYLGLHEYWDVQGPQDMWGWWAGRYLKCPWNVPIIIGECGIDRYVRDASIPSHLRGWKNNINADLYMKQLSYYDDRLHEDSRIFSAQIFTYDFANPWGVFDVRNDDMKNLLIANADKRRDEQESGVIDITDSLPKGPGTYALRPLSAIDKVVIHHSATPQDVTPQAIAKYHTNPKPDGNGWPGTGYHFLVYADGKVYQTNHLETVSYHAGNTGSNESGIGICFVGDYLTAVPPSPQIEAGKALYKNLQKTLGLLDIKPHYLYTSTQCPGPWWTLLVPPPPSPKPTDYVHLVRQQAWRARQIPQNEESAFFRKAKELNLGTPITSELDLNVPNGPMLRWQGFAAGILFCVVGDWGNIQRVSWA